MGAWGVGTFENDDASDWVYQLEAVADLGLIRTSLEAAAKPQGYLEASLCSEALAAAEVVAALSARPAPDLPENVRSWVASHRLSVAPDLRALTLQAVDQVARESELQELWAESEEAQAWGARVRELRARVAG